MNSTNQYIPHAFNSNTNKIYKIKNIKNTLPHLSVKILNKISPNNYLRRKLYLEQIPLEFSSTTSINQPQCKRVYSLDINSLYPFALLNKLPISTKNSKKESKIIVCTLYPPNFSRFIYINKYINIHITTKEFNLLKNIGYIIKVLYTYKTPFSSHLFLDFILHIYNTKYSHPSPSKHLLNSMYGKILRKGKITYNARILTIITIMLSYIRLITYPIKSNPINPSVYSDIDSFNFKHQPKLPISKHIGQLKLQHTTNFLHFTDKISISSKKNYYTLFSNNKIYKHKGNFNKSNIKPYFCINNKPVNFIQIEKLNIIYTIINAPSLILLG